MNYTSIDRAKAISSLKPGAIWTDNNSILDWDASNSQSKPTEAQIFDEIGRLRYQGQRLMGVGNPSGYVAVTEQLDQLYHDMQDGKLGVAATTGSWYVGITSVKTAFPKPS